ncbi:MAG TPA: hypothetical protein VM513_27210 [Kofleriaceae bacterium]|jgi:hypothetical protein|nr:hypothetical protein [Kofleriaceae bacterium]
MRRSIVTGSLCFVFACGGGSDNPPGTPDAPGPPSDAPPLIGEKFSLEFGPLSIPPSEEGTKCIWLRLDNETPIKVRQLHNVLSSSSHHLIVYKDDMDTTEQTTPVDCQPFTGALNTTGMIAPIMITQKADDALTLPDGVAYTLDANQMIKIEMHYLNATDATQEARATVEFYRADESTIQHEADILFIGSPDIDIPAGETKTLKQFFKVPSYLDLSSSNIFAITGHTHQYGTDMQVRVAPSKTGPMTSVYAPQPFSWSEPETTDHAPGFSVPAGGGFEFECTYHNTGTLPVGFGESADDEMCFFWAYYYPSQGSKVCVHTEQYGGADGLNVCCPGDSLCALIEDQF